MILKFSFHKVFFFTPLKLPFLWKSYPQGAPKNYLLEFGNIHMKAAESMNLLKTEQELKYILA